MAAERGLPIGEDDLHGLVDGVLPPDRAALVRAYLEAQPAVAARVGAYAAQREALRAALAFKKTEPIPSRLRLANLRAARRQRALARWRVAAAAAALVLAGTGLGWTLRGQVAPEMAGLPAAAESAALHRLATGPAVPVEAQASETDLAPWLAARLGEEMPLPDLAEFGFTLDAAWVLPGRRQAAILRYVGPDGVALSVWRQPDDKAEAQPLHCADGPGGLVTYTWADGQYRHAVSAILPRDMLRPMALAVERFMREAPRRALLAALPRRPCLTETG